MKKALIFSSLILLAATNVFAASVFDSNDTPVEIKLAPAVNAKSVETPKTQTASVQSNAAKASIKEVKFNNALTNLDDAQVELRQELAVAKAKYQAALNEKNKVTQNCKTLKKEINEINRKMKNVEKSKKMINKNLDIAK